MNRAFPVSMVVFVLCVLSRVSGIHAEARRSEALSSETRRPNIVVILADDMGVGDISACNSGSKIPTPHIDRLAREGMMFTDAHSSSGVCTPTRYSLLTGRYHWRTHLQSGVLGGFSRPLIARDRLTLGGLLQREGYHTACIGKWHLGMNWQLKGGAVADDGGDYSQPFKDVSLVDYIAPIQDGPVDRGFHHFCGISASLDMFPYVWINDRLPTEVASVEKAFHRPGPAGAKFEAIDVQGGIIDHTIAWIEQRARAATAAREGQPFFAYVPLAAPHTPIVPAPRWQGVSRINPYADFVRQVDADVGRLLDALDAQGLTDNTLVIFTSDNGCSPAANIQELLAAGHNPSHIYRGHKADVYEGAHRIPFLVRWPGKVKSGSVSDQLIGQFDFLATFAELLGVTLPPDAGEDSVSFLAVLLGKPEGPVRTSLISQSINGSFAIRDGDWKLALCSGSGGWSFPRPGKDDHTGLPEFQLFDLRTDPGETTNLVDKQPERVVAMKAALATAIARGRTTPGPDQVNDVGIVMVKPIPGSPRVKPRDEAQAADAIEPVRIPYDVAAEAVFQELTPAFCWFHPRIAPLPGYGLDGRPAVVMTIQKHLSADDHYSGMYFLRTDDLGKTWTRPTEIPELAWRRGEDGETIAVCDVTPGWHSQSGKLVAIGTKLRYSQKGEQLLDKPRSHECAYCTFDPKTGQWTGWKLLTLPGTEGKFFLVAPGCAQWLVNDDGSLLIPIYFKGRAGSDYIVTVLHCSFDGQELGFLSHGDELEMEGGRGFAEPSLVRYRGTYYLTLRNDAAAYVTTSGDGLRFKPVTKWTFDDGQELGSYNTQAHWLVHANGLFLTYTRRGANNDHIARNRAPIFIGQIDPGKLQVMRRTERELLPERGVMLGNFGATAITTGESWVTDSEYILTGVPHARGADGTTWLGRVKWSEPNTLVK